LDATQGRRTANYTAICAVDTAKRDDHAQDVRRISLLVQGEAGGCTTEAEAAL
jgi:hypothetical protein